MPACPSPRRCSSPPPFDTAALSGIAYASLLAFFAFIGFEDLANVVEEAKVPHRDIPRAMVLTLVISTVLYVAVAAIAVTAVPVGRARRLAAPLSLVFRAVAGVSPLTISVIAIVATLNTILAQMTHGRARHLRHGAPRRSAALCRPRASENGDADDRHRPDRGGDARARAARAVRAAGGRHLARHAVVFALVNLSLLRLR